MGRWDGELYGMSPTVEEIKYMTETGPPEMYVDDRTIR